MQISLGLETLELLNYTPCIYFSVLPCFLWLQQYHFYIVSHARLIFDTFNVQCSSEWELETQCEYVLINQKSCYTVSDLVCTCWWTAVLSHLTAPALIDSNTWNLPDNDLESKHGTVYDWKTIYMWLKCFYWYIISEENSIATKTITICI